MEVIFFRVWTCFFFVLILSACHIDPGNINSTQISSIEFVSPNQTYFLVNSVNPDYSASAISVVAADNPRLQKNDLLPDGSDFIAQCSGEFIYHIGRFQRDRVTKFHVEVGMLWQMSTLDQLDLGVRERLRTSNPQGLIFIDQDQALLSRFDSQWAWMIDLNQGTKSNELSFKKYADSDGLSEMTSAMTDNGYAYLVHNRIARTGQSWQFNQTAFLSKVLLVDLTEHDFSLVAGFEGIPLKLKNFQTNPALIDNHIFLAASGNLIGNTDGAGLEVVNLANGHSQVHLAGMRVQKVLTDGENILVMLYKDWNEFTLHLLSFDHATQKYTIDQAPLVANLQDVISESGKVWVLKANHVFQYEIDKSKKLNKINQFKINSKMRAQSIQRCHY
jgi:hypothetical protein